MDQVHSSSRFDALAASAPEELKSLTGELFDVLRSFDPVDFSRIPFDGSWSAAGLAEHILKSNIGFLKRINLARDPCTRDPAQKVQAMRDLFLDRSRKFVAAKSLEPSLSSPTHETLLRDLEKLMSDLNRMVREQDLSKICSGFEFPGLGLLTGLELTYGCIYHTQRHIWQLRKIKAVFG